MIELYKFVRSCEDGMDKLDRQGQVNYPTKLEARMDKTTTYNAALDVRDNPARPSAIISGRATAGEPVTVQCLVAARLTPVGDNIEVVHPDEAVDGGWEYQTFTAQGVLEWSWDVTAKTPDDEQVKLELRPAVIGLTAVEVSQAAKVEYITEVDVEASASQSVSHWFGTDWEAWVAIIAAVSGAVLGFVTFSASFREALARVVASAARETRVVAASPKAGDSGKPPPSNVGRGRRPPKQSADPPAQPKRQRK